MKKLLSLLLALTLLTTAAAALASPNKGASPAFLDTIPAQTTPATGYQKQDADVPEYGWEQDGYTEVAATPVPFEDQARDLLGQIYAAFAAVLPNFGAEVDREAFIESALMNILNEMAKDSQITEEMVLEQLRNDINEIKQQPPILLPPVLEAN